MLIKQINKYEAFKGNLIRVMGRTYLVKKVLSNNKVMLEEI